MSLTYQSTKRNRVYVRKFDHEEAQARYDAGESIRELAEAYGVTRDAIYQVVTESGRASVLARRERMKGAARCRRCGSPMHLTSFYNGSRFCVPCANQNQATSVGDGELQCMTCREWKPDEEFPRNRRAKKARRGRHNSCRSCQTILRREYREKNKVPCIGCGKLTLRPSEKTTNGSPWPRCSSCASRGVVPFQAGTEDPVKLTREQESSA